MSSLPLLESVFTASEQTLLRPKFITLATHHHPSLVIDARARARTRRFNSLSSPPLIRNKVHGRYNGLNSLILSSRRQRLHSTGDTSSAVSCTINMSAGQSDSLERLFVDSVMDEIKKEWERLPQPVKTFPWFKALKKFIGLILGLVFAVVKYLSVPVLAVTTLSEMSYSAHERKMLILPISVLAGATVAGNWNDMFKVNKTKLKQRAEKDCITLIYEMDEGRSHALDHYGLKEGDYAWHLAVMTSFFVLLKLLGPYYPYWLRIFIPHFANGGLLRIAWLAFLWYRRPREASQTMQTSASYQQ